MSEQPPSPQDLPESRQEPISLPEHVEDPAEGAHLTSHQPGHPGRQSSP